MKKWAIIFVLLFSASAFANPVFFDPVTDIRLVIVLVSTLGLEVFITTIILLFCHMALVPSLIALFLGNITMYFVIFLPIFSVTENLLLAEVVIVAAEGTFIKIISLFDTFQLEDFKKLKWRTAFISALVGNALSYYVGTVLVGQRMTL